jgi:hypothetical protein
VPASGGTHAKKQVANADLVARMLRYRLGDVAAPVVF